MQMNNVSNLTVQDRTFLFLRKSILDLTLSPGAVMSSGGIANMMKVSRTPVREAFIRLEQEGLVNIIPQKETIVSPIDLERVAQEQFLREGLEVAALEPCVKLCTQEDIEKLRVLISLQRERAEKGDHVASIEFDDKFHQMIFTIAGQELSWNVIEGMGGHYRRVRLLVKHFDEVTNRALKQHEEIVSALEEKDYLKAQAIARNHVRKISAEVEMIREKYPDYFRVAGEEPFVMDYANLKVQR